MLRDFGCPSSLKLGRSDCHLTHGVCSLCCSLFFFVGGMGVGLCYQHPSLAQLHKGTACVVLDGLLATGAQGSKSSLIWRTH